MTTYVRKNAFNNRGTFDNTDLLWYAKGVRAMQARALDDPASWWFFAAMHGEYVSPENAETQFPGWGFIPGPPAVPVTPLPSVSVIDRYWNQCQHQSWYFPPWHRGYLLALEAQLRADIKSEGCPEEWALPYWNYFGPAPQFDIPPAFTQKNLPDGTPNPLFVTNRFGPRGDGVVFVPTAAGMKAHPGNPVPGRPVAEDCMSNTSYTCADANTPYPGFGGPLTSFWHGGGISGNLESNPHNLVHVYTGGSVTADNYGLMSDPGTAGLDPIFYLHHANIDRMWEVWNTNPANKNPNKPWLDGPGACGDRDFVMPMPRGSSWVYTPRDVRRTSQLNYTYDNLAQPAAPQNVLADRLTRLGAAAAAARVTSGSSVVTGGAVELVGANEGSLRITGAVAETTVRLDNTVRERVSASLARASETASPDRVYLKLENVRGAHDASVLSVFVNLPANSQPGDHPELLAGSVALFGLRRSSIRDGKHAGTGLSFMLDISDIVDALHLNRALSADSLRVTVVPDRPLPDNAEITVGRVSIYRHGI